MIKMIITEAFVSKGYENAPAIKFIDTEDGNQIANFRIGKRVYDSKADNNHRWLNFTVKAFGSLCERIKKMKLKDGSCINFVARYDEESWTDKESGKQRTAAVLYLEEIEYAGGSQKNGQNGAGNGQGTQGYPQNQQHVQGQPQQQSCPQNQPPAQGQYQQQGYPQNQQQVQGQPQGQPPQQRYPQGQQTQQYPQGQMQMQGQPQGQMQSMAMPENFTGYEGFGGKANPFY